MSYDALISGVIADPTLLVSPDRDVGRRLSRIEPGLLSSSEIGKNGTVQPVGRVFMPL